MLSTLRYLLGVAEVGLLASSSWLGATQARRRLLPDFTDAPAHLATAVLALSILVWTAQLLGSAGFFEPLPYLFSVVAVGVGMWAALRPAGGIGAGWARRPRLWSAGSQPGQATHPGSGAARKAAPPRRQGPRVGSLRPATLVALAIATVAVVLFADGVQEKLGTGMTGFDSTWYHGPFAAGFFQRGDTWDLHFIAPQFLAWLYPANAEIFHAVGMLAFGRDILSPLLNLGWFVGCLMACWCIGRPYEAAPWSLGLGAIALSVPALADQAGEARNDIVGIFFLLAAVAIALNAWSGGGATRDRPSVRSSPRMQGKSANALGALAVSGLAAGLAAGTKLNFLLPAAVLVVGLALIAPAGARWRAFAATGIGALAGGGYWYLRNLIHTGNPLPWIDGIGPISLPAPDQALGGREGHSVLGYLTDGSVWSDWFLPGFHGGLWIVWPLLVGAALAGLLLCLAVAKASPSPADGPPSPSPIRAMTGDSSSALRLAGLVGLVAALAWLIAPTSASGPDGMPRGFESGLRYLAPALILGLALLPVAAHRRLRGTHLRGVASGRDGLAEPTGCGALGRIPSTEPIPGAGQRVGPPRSPHPGDRTRGLLRFVPILLALAAAIAIGYPIQRHYLESRYADPSFTTPGLNAAFAWARDIADARIATTSTRQYPFFGTNLSNHVDFIGTERPHGGFVAPKTCRAWRRLLDEGDYDYVIASRDRIEPGKPPYPPTARWAEGPGAEVVLRTPPTVIYKLSGPLDPSACR